MWNGNTPKPLQLGVRRLGVIGMVQAAIGFSQYWLHVPAALVELHVIGAVSLTIGVTQFHLRQTAHDREPGIKSPAAPVEEALAAR
jgi:heme A synthase